MTHPFLIFTLGRDLYCICQELIAKHLQNDVTLWNISIIVLQDVTGFVKAHKKWLLILLALVCSVLLAKWHKHSWNFAAAVIRYAMIQVNCLD